MFTTTNANEKPQQKPEKETDTIKEQAKYKNIIYKIRIRKYEHKNTNTKIRIRKYKILNC